MQLVEVVFADTLVLRLTFSVLEHDKLWLSNSLEHSLERVLTLAKVHVDVVHVSNIYSGVLSEAVSGNLWFAHSSSI